MELESNNQVLRKYKNFYQATKEVKCLGCSKSFSPVLFKGHF